jgi:hypothetical protein
VIVAIALAEFIHEVLQMRRQVRRLGRQNLLQPFAYGIANRSARLAINPFGLVGVSAVHGEFRFLAIALGYQPPSRRCGNCFAPISAWPQFVLADGFHSPTGSSPGRGAAGALDPNDRVNSSD